MSRATRKSRRGAQSDAGASEHRTAGSEGPANAGERTCESLAYQAGFAQLIAAIARDFIAMAPEEIDGGIQAALRAVGEYAGADRAFLFELSDDLSPLVNTHEWCADLVVSQFERLEGLPKRALPWAGSRIASREIICVPRVSELPPEARAEKDIWGRAGSKSLIILPLEAAGKLLGAVGLDTVRAEREWSEDLIALLRTVAEVLANVLDRKRGEEPLRESSKRLLKAQRVARMGFLDWNLRTNEIYWSQQIFDLFGIEQGESRASVDMILDLVHPDDLEFVKKNLDMAIEGVKGYDIDHRVLRPDGKVIWVHAQAELVRDADGNAEGLLGTVVDITDRRRVEEALRESEDRLRLIADTVEDVFWITDWVDHRTTFVSQAYEKVWGQTAESLYASPTAWADAIHPDDRQRAWQHFEGMQAGDRYEETYRVIRPDGSIRWIRDRGFPVCDEDGQVERVVGIAQDITERKLAEDRIARLNRLTEQLIGPAPLEEKLKRITDAVVDMFEADFARIWLTRQGDLCDSGCVHATAAEESHVCCDRDRCLHLIASSGRYTHTDGKVHRRVPFGCYKIGRVAAAEEAGFLTNDVTCDPHVHDHDWAQSLGLVSFAGYRLLSDEAAPIGALALFSKKPLSYEEAAVLQTAADTASQVVVAARSEEERLSLQRQLQHSQKLESLGVLAGGIAHDFNNILMAILGNADLALDQLSPMSPARGNLQEIEKASKRAAELAKQMLAYSGKGRFVVQPIDASQLVEEMAHLLEVSVSKKAVLRYNFAPDLPTFVGDVTQIRQVVLNLITNAAEAIGDESGVIALSTGAMYCDRAYLDDIDAVLRASLDESLPEGVYTYFEVADTGCGMDAETIEKIFDPFFTTKFTGRGLGMSAVLGIVRGHKGALKIRSEVGKGTTFNVLFPATELPAELATNEQSETKKWRGSGIVLLVDDEEVVLRVVQRMIEGMGFEVLCASDGREALDVFRVRGEEIACVLLDLTMPHLDGEQIFREIRRMRPDVKVILSSGYDESDVKQRFAGEGPAGFIQKPYRSDSLEAKLKEVLAD